MLRRLDNNMRLFATVFRHRGKLGAVNFSSAIGAGVCAGVIGGRSRGIAVDRVELAVNYVPPPFSSIKEIINNKLIRKIKT